MSDARHLEEFIEVPEMCSICGERKPAGFWCGAVDIWVCKFCALDVLPKLMADCVVYGVPGGRPSWREIQDALLRAEKNFYYASTIALTRKKEKEMKATTLKPLKPSSKGDEK